MSVKTAPIEPVPEHTARIARAAFPKGNSYLTLRDELGTLYRDEDFAGLFTQRGQPALPPWRLALVTMLQFHENLSDRQAAQAVRAPAPEAVIECLGRGRAVQDLAVPPNLQNRFPPYITYL